MSHTSNITTPSDIDIQPRRMNFPFEQLTDKYFFDDNPIKSAFIAALSATFPAGEGEFIESVRRFRDQTDDAELKKQIKGFIGQEGHHSFQHKRFNQALKELGFDAVRLESDFEKDLQWTINGKTDRHRLAYTVCFEHLTAIMSDYFLRDTRTLDGMNDTIKHLMLWHTVEEIEHKAVAFDLFMTCDGDRKLLRKALVEASLLFSWRITKYTFRLLRWSNIKPSWQDVKGYSSFMFGQKGLLRSLRKPYLDFFRKDFHPWDHQNQTLIDQWQQTHYQAEFDRASDLFKKTEATSHA
ncbi:metal-dependent hydrolase [Litoribacillus peritrichatus]|uniref:Metal-dependent hydrolase n=1 Tax=Litoribacillus peritrichatus TaxID=718191 RepID=A0ABP7M739_9GAMM